MTLNERCSFINNEIVNLKKLKAISLAKCNGYDVHYARYMYLSGLIEGYVDELSLLNSLIVKGGKHANN